MPSDSPTLPIDSEFPSASPVEIETEAPIKAPTDIAAPSCPPIDTGGKSGIVNGGSGIAEEYKHMKSGDKSEKVGKATEDMDRYLRTGGGVVECPESNQPESGTTTKKNMAKEGVDKSPKEDVMKNSNGTKEKESQKKKKDDDKQSGKMDVSNKASGKGKVPSGKGTKSAGESKAKHEKNITTTKHNVTSSDLNGKGGKGKSDTSTVKAPSKASVKGELTKESNGSTEDLDDEERKHTRVRVL